ncbi:MAG: TIGR01212 family radical SAM protein [Planctomycetota bacterium]
MGQYYYSFSAYLKDKFPGQRVYKIALDAGFSCPHRTKDLRLGGCIYCENKSFSPNARLEPRPSVSEQIRSGMDFYRRRYQAEKFMAYFQAYTNTYAPPDQLKKIYDEIAEFKDVVGLSIGTRPDCVPDETLDLITSYTDRYLVWLEYGLQSKHDRTLKFIRRGHNYESFVDAVKRTQGRNISICAHIILGLPGETKQDMVETVQAITDLNIDGIKLHNLYVSKNTSLEQLYQKGEIKLLTFEEYVPLLCDLLELLPPKMVVQRVTGELAGEYLVAPKWEVNKGQIIRAIEIELKRRNTYQGHGYHNPVINRIPE